MMMIMTAMNDLLDEVWYLPEGSDLQEKGIKH
jgi:hypothetical protein